jgi:CRP-like cAMP-binding protein
VIEGFVANDAEGGTDTRDGGETFFRQLLAAGKEVVRNRGEFLFKEGDDADGVYFVLRGSLQFCRAGCSNSGTSLTRNPSELKRGSMFSSGGSMRNTDTNESTLLHHNSGRLMPHVVGLHSPTL